MHLWGRETVAVLNEWRETRPRQQRLPQNRMEADRWNRTVKWQ